MKKSSILCLGLMLALMGCETSGELDLNLDESDNDETKFAALTRCIELGGVYHSATNTCTCHQTGKKICENDAVSNKGRLYSCNTEGGELQGPTACIDNEMSTDEIIIPVSCNIEFNGCGECLNGEIKCENGELIRCKNGIKIRETCENGVSCNAAGTACGVCKNGEMKCENGVFITCISGRWTPKTCENNASCNADNTAHCDCENGETQTNDIQNEICENGAWKVESCIPPYVENEGKCVECIENKCILLTSDNSDSQLPQRCELYKEIALVFAKQTTGLKKFLEWIDNEGCNSVLQSTPEETQPSMHDCIDTIESFDCTKKELKDLLTIKYSSGLSVAMKCVDHQWKVDEACTEPYGTEFVNLTQCSPDKKTCEKE